jgi:hypothetical protein
MADARREHEYDVALATIGYLGAAWSGRLRPSEANPYRDRPPGGAADRDDEAGQGWELLRNCLKGLAGQRG